MPFTARGIQYRARFRFRALPATFLNRRGHIVRFLQPLFMEFTIHTGVLSLAFAIAVAMGAVSARTGFCAMGGVSDWLNMGHLGRLHSWLFAITIATAGLLLLEATGAVTLPEETFPPYRTANFAWLRYLLGGLVFGSGMTLASGCGNRTLVRLGGGNLKSLVVLLFAAPAAYAMLWTDAFGVLFLGWIGPTTLRLGGLGITSQELGSIAARITGTSEARIWHFILGGMLVLGFATLLARSRDFRERVDYALGGGIMGLAIVAGWYITGGSLGRAWKEYAEFADVIPSRVAVQSYTFISPMGDMVRYLTAPRNLSLINFGICAMAGVVTGSLLYALFTRSFRVEWFASGADFLRHAAGGVMMGVGGVLAMGCTIGQGVTGVSTLAAGSLLALASIIAGSAFTLRLEYHLLEGRGIGFALRRTLSDLRLPLKPSV